MYHRRSYFIAGMGDWTDGSCRVRVGNPQHGRTRIDRGVRATGGTNNENAEYPIITSRGQHLYYNQMWGHHDWPDVATTTAA